MFQFGQQVVRNEREVHQTFANLEQIPPGVVLHRRFVLEGDELDVALVLERNQGVVRSAVGMVTPDGDGESEAFVVSDGLREVIDRNDDMVYCRGHVDVRSFPDILWSRLMLNA